MTKKRLDRDAKWFFQGFPYYQMRMDTDDFRGLVSVIELRQHRTITACGFAVRLAAIFSAILHRIFLKGVSLP
ncbi:MAG: hypothetical protein NC237_09220, partial [Eubacterium sp.]|nr:hypothetical protein [Eubacterium sp.]